MRLLTTLAAAPGRPLPRQQLLDTVWPDVLVNEEALSRAISQLRRALGDDPRAPRFVETVHKSGYCLIAPVSDPRAETEPQPKPVPATSRRRWTWTLLAVVAAALLAAILYSGVGGSPAAPAPRSLVPLTSDPGREIDPALSPDGARVVYLASSRSGYDLFVRGIQDGAAIRLTSDRLTKGHPAWSPDGKRIAFVAADGGAAGIYMITLSGRTTTKLVDLPSWSFGLDWSPDGRTLAYSDAGPGEAPRIVPFDVASKVARPIAISGSSAGDVKPVFSPDGKRIAFIRNDALGRQQIAVVDLLRDAETTVLTAFPQQVRGLDWAPDGDSLIYSARSGRRFRLWRVPAGSGAPEPLLVEGGDLFNPSVASNGRIVVEDVEQDRDVWRVAFEGGAATPLIRSTSDDYEPTQATDGVLAFVSERSGTPEIWLRSPFGDERRLTSLGGDQISRLFWSKDGERLVFLGAEEGVAAIYAASRRGRMELLLRTSKREVPIGWSAAKDRLFMLAPKGRHGQLEELDLTAGTSRRITPIPVEATAVAADGRSIFAVASGQSRLLRIDHRGVVRQFRLPPSLGSLSAVLPAEDHVYLVTTDQGSAILHRPSLNTDRIEKSVQLEYLGGGKLALSPDARSLTYTHARETANDLAWTLL